MPNCINVVAPPYKNTDNNELFEQFENITDSLFNFKILISGIQQQIKHLEKEVKKKLKGLKKDIDKNKNKGNRNPSGFAKPCKVSKDLCEFMNKSHGTELARTEVTKALVAYIKTNKLENENNSKIITPDQKLKFLLGIDEDQELTYFNIQKFMNKHFLKCEDVVV